jgi:hypothetical protein
MINYELESIWKEAVVAVLCTIRTFMCEDVGIEEFVSYINVMHNLTAITLGVL